MKYFVIFLLFILAGCGRVSALEIRDAVEEYTEKAGIPLLQSYADGDCETAVPELHNMMDEAKDPAWLHFQLGVCSQIMNDPEDAIAHLKLYVDAYPDTAHARLVRTWIQDLPDEDTLAVEEKMILTIQRLMYYRAAELFHQKSGISGEELTFETDAQHFSQLLFLKYFGLLGEINKQKDNSSWSNSVTNFSTMGADVSYWQQFQDRFEEHYYQVMNDSYEPMYLGIITAEIDGIDGIVMYQINIPKNEENIDHIKKLFEEFVEIHEAIRD